MKSSEALKKIRLMLETGEYLHVCIALQDISAKNTQVYRRIQETIRPYDTVVLWLFTHHTEFAQELQKQFGPKTGVKSIV